MTGLPIIGGWRLLLPLAAILLLANPVSAGTSEMPEIEDAIGDAVHFEFQNEEPTLDVSKVWLNWTDDDLIAVHIEGPTMASIGPEATTDPADEATAYDVYWTHGGANQVARLWVDADGSTSFWAGSSMRIERMALWDESDDIHGTLAEQTGLVSLGSPGLITILVNPEVVGDPGAGDTLTELAFSTYVDHHPPAPGTPFGEHHPGHVDQNDAPGQDFTIPGEPTGPDAPAPPSGEASPDGSSDDAPLPGGVAVLFVVGLVGLALRRRRS